MRNSIVTYRNKSLQSLMCHFPHTSPVRSIMTKSRALRKVSWFCNTHIRGSLSIRNLMDTTPPSLAYQACS